MSLVDINRYHEEKGKLRILVCDECQGEFMLVKDSIKVEEITVNGENLVLTYFTCPHCNKLYKITLDNTTTIQLRGLYELYLNKLTGFHKKNQAPTEKLINRVNKQKKLLDKEYERLDKTYKGVFYQK